MYILRTCDGITKLHPSSTALDPSSSYRLVFTVIHLPYYEALIPMLILESLKLIPASLLLFVITTSPPAQAIEARWPPDLPAKVGRFPNDDSLLKRNIDIQKRLVHEKPIGVRKMNDDEGEMFFLEYWRFDGGNQESTLENDPSQTMRKSQARPLDQKADERRISNAWLNTTVLSPLQAPFSRHATQEEAYDRALSPRAVLHFLNRRNFQCPTGTASCDSTSRPNSCCPNGEVCQLITDVGLGDVGCCAQGQSCSNEVSSCQQGYTSCPGSSGGGCCIPGYICNGVGCKN